MRSLAIAGVLLASCTLAAAQQTPGRSQETPAQSGNWSTRPGSGDDNPAAKKTLSTDKKADPPPAPPRVFRQRAHEEEILNRRNEVILKLREIGQRTGDIALLRLADDLQERAWNLYLQKTAGVGDVVDVRDNGSGMINEFRSKGFGNGEGEGAGAKEDRR